VNCGHFGVHALGVPIALGQDKEVAMNTVTRRDQSRSLTSLQDQVLRLIEDNSAPDRLGHADLATWAPTVDIYETEKELS
jgi:hypothetical protein